MKVVVDASPLISLAVIDQLDLLSKLFTEIIIPQAVYQEITIARYKKDAPKIEVFIKNLVYPCEEEISLQFSLGQGEAAAIDLYRELNADILIIDDKKARVAAESLGIRCIGTLGLLTLAKKKGFIAELRKYFIQLIKKQRYFSYELLNQVLEINQEKHLKRDPFIFNLSNLFKSITKYLGFSKNRRNDRR